MYLIAGLSVFSAGCSSPMLANSAVSSETSVVTGLPVSNPTNPTQVERESINLEATDPLAPFRQIQLRSIFNTSRWQTDSGSTDYEFRTVYPFNAWDRGNILRIILPFTPEPEDLAPLKDIEIVNVALYKQRWGLAGIGMVSSVATNTINDQSNFSLGPYLAFSVHPNNRLQWGLGNKNFISGRPTLSTLSPILTYALPGDWDVGLSDMTYVYDWQRRQLVTAPLGISVGKVLDAGRQPVCIS